MVPVFTPSMGMSLAPTSLAAWRMVPSPPKQIIRSQARKASSMVTKRMSSGRA